MKKVTVVLVVLAGLLALPAMAQTTGPALWQNEERLQVTTETILAPENWSRFADIARRDGYTVEQMKQALEAVRSGDFKTVKVENLPDGAQGGFFSGTDYQAKPETAQPPINPNTSEGFPGLTVYVNRVLEKFKYAPVIHILHFELGVGLNDDGTHNAIVFSGTLVRNGQNGADGHAGQDGATGATGATGANGKDGVSPPPYVPPTPQCSHHEEAPFCAAPAPQVITRIYYVPGMVNGPWGGPPPQAQYQTVVQGPTSGFLGGILGAWAGAPRSSSNFVLSVAGGNATGGSAQTGPINNTANGGTGGAGGSGYGAAAASSSASSSSTSAVPGAASAAHGETSGAGAAP